MSQIQRQQQGLACEECRRRKARCDRGRPSCGYCQNAGATCCYVDKRPQRGPRKGQMDALKNLVANLEQQLSEQTGQQQPNRDAASTDAFQKYNAAPEAIISTENDNTFAERVSTTPSIYSENNNIDNVAFGNTSLGSFSLSRETTPFASSRLISIDMNSVGGFDGSPDVTISDQNSSNDWFNDSPVLSPSAITSGNQQLFASKHMQLLGGSALSDLMQTDLDELYFDRVHPVAPNIHRRNYFAWASQKCLSPAQRALQYAMRAVSAAVSAQYRSISGMLYAESCRILRQIDANGTGEYNDTPIEQTQSWLLVAHYELLCKHEHQAMLTAGRAIRMVQLARLHDIDAYNMSLMSLGVETPLSSTSTLADESFTETEEKRRTFWLAYCFDRFCLMRSACPPSLQEESIRTRLPAPEANFQNNQPIKMDFLPEALAQSGRTMLPPFAECVVLNSLFSRCLSHQRLDLASPVSGENDSRKFWSKHTWLTLPVEKRKQLLIQSLQSATGHTDDPMLAFVHALAACAAINVYQLMAHFMTWPTVDQEVAAPAYEKQAIQAATELVSLVKMMPRSISHFKTHPFLPTVIHRTAVFLMGLPGSTNSIKTGCNNRGDDLNTLLEALKDLQQINNLSRTSLCKLEKNDS